MKALFALVPVTLFALASCGSGETKPTSSAGGDPSTTSGSGQLRTCRPTCTTAADCAVPGQPLQDAGHFTCKANRCEWLGCQSANECQSALQTSKVTCATEPGAEVASCVVTCNAAADCAIQGSPLGDASHFACNAGKCTWTGCKSTSECQSAAGSNNYVCETPPGASTATCLPTCQTPADCAVPGSKLNDASHYACQANRCVWQGCKNTTECAADLHASNVVCE
jgi:hypothetical protein